MIETQTQGLDTVRVEQAAEVLNKVLEPQVASIEFHKAAPDDATMLAAWDLRAQQQSAA